MTVKRPIRFLDLDGNPVEEDWYFLLDMADVAEMNLVHDHEDVEEYLISIIKNKDSKRWVSIMKELIFASVGKREGNAFVKDSDITREFSRGGAYRQLFSELIDSPDAGASFFEQMMPDSVRRRAAEEQKKAHSKEDLLAMTDEEFDRIVGTDLREMTKEQQTIAFQRRVGKAA